MTVHAFSGPGADGAGDDEPQVRPTALADSPLDALKAAMARPLRKEHLALSPLKRPEVEVRIRTNINLDEINEWRKGAVDPSFASGVNLVRLACIFLANACTDILVNGESTGLTLASAAIRELVPTASPVDDEAEVVRKFFDGEDLWLSGRVLPALSTAWSGGPDDGDGPLRPTTDQSRS